MRIVSDGTPEGTHIFDEIGRDLTLTEHITHVSWNIGGGSEPARATVEFNLVKLEAEVDSNNFMAMPMAQPGDTSYVSE